MYPAEVPTPVGNLPGAEPSNLPGAVYPRVCSPSEVHIHSEVHSPEDVSPSPASPLGMHSQEERCSLQERDSPSSSAELQSQGT